MQRRPKRKYVPDLFRAELKMRNAPLLILFISLQPSVLHAQRTYSGALAGQTATQLAEVMCRQLPNSAGFPLKGNLIGDDVHDTLVELGQYSLPCLIDHITDSTWMPDPRQEPLVGDFRAGDAAFYILCDKGLDFNLVLPMLDKKAWEAIGVYAYFEWVNKANHRRVLQDLVRRWVSAHPACCNTDLLSQARPGTGPHFQLSAERVSALRQRVLRVWPGMDESVARKMLGKPDFEVDQLNEGIEAIIDLDREERSAQVFSARRWSALEDADFGKRDFLRDQYVIVFFTTQGKLARIFSNVPQIPPMYPRSRQLWMTLMFGKDVARQ